MGIFVATLTSPLIIFWKQQLTYRSETKNPISQILSMLYTWTVLLRSVLIYSGTVMGIHIPRKE